MFTVTSEFKSLAESVNPFRVNLKFTFSGSEETVRLLKASNITRTAKQFSSGRLTVNLANTDTTSPVRPGYNIIQSDKSHFFREGTYNISFSSSAGGESENFALFTGKLTGANFKEQRVTLTFLDKHDDLKKRTIGDVSDPVQFINSDWNPADLFWTIVTSYGRLSNIASTNNPDIDYDSFLTWKSNAEALPMQVQAEFKGATVVDAVKKLADITNSVIVGESDNKIYTSIIIPTAISSAVTLADSVVFDMDLNIDTSKMLNQGAVLFDYDVNGAVFTNSLTAANTTSINTFGLKETIFSDPTVWHSTKQSAQNFLDQKIALAKDPVSKFRVDVGYMGLAFQLNDSVFVLDEPLSLDGTQPFAITGLEYNVARGESTLTVENRLGNEYFFLDHATLGLLDQSNNPLF